MVVRKRHKIGVQVPRSRGRSTTGLAPEHRNWRPKNHEEEAKPLCGAAHPGYHTDPTESAPCNANQGHGPFRCKRLAWVQRPAIINKTLERTMRRPPLPPCTFCSHQSAKSLSGVASAKTPGTCSLASGDPLHERHDSWERYSLGLAHKVLPLSSPGQSALKPMGNHSIGVAPPRSCSIRQDSTA